MPNKLFNIEDSIDFVVERVGRASVLESYTSGFRSWLCYYPFGLEQILKLIESWYSYLKMAKKNIPYLAD